MSMARCRRGITNIKDDHVFSACFCSAGSHLGAPVMRSITDLDTMPCNTVYRDREASVDTCEMLLGAAD